MRQILSGAKLISYSLIIAAFIGLSCKSTDNLSLEFKRISAFDLTKPYETSITINSGTPETRSTKLKVRLSARDNIGIVGYYLSHSPKQPGREDLGWINISPAAALSVSKIYQLKQMQVESDLTLYVWFKDAAGNVSKKSSARIIYLL